MITIALDEGGHFENLQNDAKCMFIGGVVFVYKDEASRRSELKRLQNFFEAVCEKEGCSYPEDLHYNRDYSEKIINLNQAKKVKDSIIKLLPDFLNGKGAWLENSPKGKYYLYALVGDKDGIKSFQEKSKISNLIDDGIGCNRYEHMAYRSVENLLFYNPRIKDTDIRLDLATRVVPASSDNEKEIKKTGHKKLKESEDKSIYEATSQASFRAAIATMLQSCNKQDIQFDDVCVESIYYHQNHPHNLNQGFLYLSDIICSLYDGILQGYNKASAAAEKLWLSCTQYVPQNNVLIWTYNDFDQKYREMYRAFENEDYYKTLKIMYELSNKDKKNAFVYENLWFSEIEKEILFKAPADSLKKSIEQLDSALESSKITVSEAKFIYDLLKPLTEELCEKNNIQQVLYHLYKAEFAINNHSGNYLASKKSFEKCKKYAQYVTVEEYLELRNMYSVCLCDAKEFDVARKLAEETLDWEKMLVEIKEVVFPEKNNVHIHYGRTLSQLAQCYAFKGEYEKAIKNFKDALKLFGEMEAEIKRTRSYLLHAYIEAGKDDDYRELAELYFGSANQKEQLISILENMENNEIACSFSLYVYLKGIYVLYSASMDKKSVTDIIRKVDEKCKDKKNHPFEMVYKYAAFLCLLVGNKEYNEKAHKYIALANNALDDPAGILKDIADDMSIQFKSAEDGGNVFEHSELTYMYR